MLVVTAATATVAAAFFQSRSGICYCRHRHGYRHHHHSSPRDWIVRQRTGAPLVCALNNEEHEGAPPLAKAGTFGICRLDADYFRQEASRTSQALRELGLPDKDGDDSGFVIINFYHLADISDPHAWLEQHREDFQARITHYGSREYLSAHQLDVKGRIFVHEQGINAQFSALIGDALQYTRWIQQTCPMPGKPEQRGVADSTLNGDADSDRPFDVMIARSDGHAFPRLTLRYKQLCQIKGGHEDLSLTDPSQRAVPLSPSEWRNALEESEDGLRGCLGKEKTIILDVRNKYEFDVGRFEGARVPQTSRFRDTAVEIPEEMEYDPETTAVLMYCTGGIRCDIYSSRLIKDGYKNLYTLEGGIQNYLCQEGNEHWNGHLFVFDNRLAVPGGVADADSADSAQVAASAAATVEISKCAICSGQCPQAPHRNCANLDCNLLFLSCLECAERLQGCCCEECTSALRLRPFLRRPGNFGKWSDYRPASSTSAEAEAVEVQNSARHKRGKRRRKQERKQPDPEAVSQAHDLVHKHRDAILNRLIERGADGANDSNDATAHSQGSLPPHSNPSKSNAALDRITRRAERYISRKRKTEKTS